MKPAIAAVSTLLSGVAVAVIRLYQWTVRPLIGPRCRFVPHCSDYAIEAYERHGPAVGSWLTAKRLGRCHPWCKGGLDPVPESFGGACRASQKAPSAISETITSQ